MDTSRKIFAVLRVAEQRWSEKSEVPGTSSKASGALRKMCSSRGPQLSP